MKRCHRVVHVISSLAVGGAEMALLSLVARLQDSGFENHVIVLGAESPLKRRFLELNVPVHETGMARRTFPGPRQVLHLMRIGRKLRPDLIQGWMAHGNLAAVLLGMGPFRPVPVVWSVHQTLGRFSDLSRTTRFALRALARLSWIPRRIIYVSRASREQHRALGFRDSKAVHVPNGVDVTAFRGGEERRTASRASLGLGASARVVGHVGRFHPAKDYRNLAAALRQLLLEDASAHAVLIGGGLTEDNPEFAGLLHEAPVARRLRLLGFRDDVAWLLPAFDVFCLSSASEACPLALLEAMSCGLRCVVTDVGDAAWMVGGSGEVVPTGDASALAAALARVLRATPVAAEAGSARARERAQELFSVDRMAERYRVIYRAAIEGRSTADPDVGP